MLSDLRFGLVAIFTFASKNLTAPDLDFTSWKCCFDARLLWNLLYFKGLLLEGVQFDFAGFPPKLHAHGPRSRDTSCTVNGWINKNKVIIATRIFFLIFEVWYVGMLLLNVGHNLQVISYIAMYHVKLKLFSSYCGSFFLSKVNI